MITIDLMSRQPIYDQLVTRVEQLILAGVYKADDQLPSVRSLSCRLAVNPNTIQRAYTMLCASGVTYSVAGKGCFVSPQATEILHSRVRTQLPAFSAMVRELMQSGVGAQELKQLIDTEYEARRHSRDPIE